MNMEYLEVKDGEKRELRKHETLPKTFHVFDRRSIQAINAALAARRPLLIRGEPGTGKSQLARAAADVLGRAFIPFTVDARTEARDLRFTVDAVARLAEAQILGHRKSADEVDARKHLAEERFTEPGPLWWVFDWASAEAQVEKGGGTIPWKPTDWKVEDGVVLLIDEIDKADPAVPNGLLEALGEGRFQVPGKTGEAGKAKIVAADPERDPPLVIITTNEERALPDAFVRRCLVLQLGWSEGEKFLDELMLRGEAQFKDLDPKVLRKAAEMVAEDRKIMRGRGMCPPGGAEYLDLLRVLDNRYKEKTVDEQIEILEEIGEFALEKHPRENPW